MARFLGIFVYTRSMLLLFFVGVPLAASSTITATEVPSSGQQVPGGEIQSA